MDERIQELAEGCTHWFEVSDGEFYEYFDKEKFAELIVRECASLCLQEGQNTCNNVWEQIRAKCDAQMILEHFEIE